MSDRVIEWVTNAGLALMLALSLRFILELSVWTSLVTAVGAMLAIRLVLRV